MNVGYSVPGVVTGKPIALGGSQGRAEATGRGSSSRSRKPRRRLGSNLNGATAVVQGFGNVGSVAARLLQQVGVKVVAIGEVCGWIYNPNGIDIDR